MARAKKDEDDESLRRLGAGRWQTRDERFTIEPQSGTWVIVDAEQTDDLGLPLVRGPFRSLTDAKAAIAGARAGGPSESPLAERLGEANRRPAASSTPTSTSTPTPGRAKSARSASAASPESKPERKTQPKPEPAPEPRWIVDLGPADRRRARKLIDKLEGLGIRDPEGLVRRDLVGNVPSIAIVAVADHLAGALTRATTKGSASAADLVEDLVNVLVDGRDDGLEVRWRLVDDDGRPIGLTARDIRAALERTETR